MTAAFSVLLLWTEETPGWWFNIIFSVILTGLALALWFAFYSSISWARDDREAQAAWAAAHVQATAEAGRVVARRVRLAEEGTPTSFELDIAVDGHAQFTAQWSLERASQRLLQTQVPGPGSPARVWRAANMPDAPVVVEVTDPTVVG